MSRLDEIEAQIEAGSPVDWEKEATLQALETVQAGKRFVDDMVVLMRDGARRYSGTKSIEFNDDGSVKRVEFHAPAGGQDG